jgi:hypothetical protein
MIIYLYDNESKVFLGSRECQSDPMNKGEFIRPPYCTCIEPPVFKKYENAFYEDGKWIVKPDNRNRAIYSRETGAIDYCQSFKIPETHTGNEPPKEPYYFFDGNEWVIHDEKKKTHEELIEIAEEEKLIAEATQKRERALSIAELGDRLKKVKK